MSINYTCPQYFSDKAKHHNSYLLLHLHGLITKAEYINNRSKEINCSIDSHLIVVTSAKIYHDVLVPGIQGVNVDSHQSKAVANVPIEEHDGAWVVQLVHLLIRRQLLAFNSCNGEHGPC